MHQLEANLSLSAALELAIRIEADARDTYLTLSQAMNTWGQHEAGHFFHRLALMEDGHRRELEARRVGVPPVSEDEIPKLVEVPALTEDDVLAMTLRQALELALRAETRARAFFLEAYERVQMPEVRQLFAELAADEIEHQQMIRNELTQLASLE